MKKVQLTFKRIDGRPAYVIATRGKVLGSQKRVGVATRSLSGLWQVRIDGKVAGRAQRLGAALEDAGMFVAVTA